MRLYRVPFLDEQLRTIFRTTQNGAFLTLRYSVAVGGLGSRNGRLLNGIYSACQLAGLGNLLANGRVNCLLTLVSHSWPMTLSAKQMLAALLKLGAVLLALNEIRGLLLAGPVLYAMYEAGGTLMALWLGFCSLAGIAASMIVPLFVAKKLEARLTA